MPCPFLEMTRLQHQVSVFSGIISLFLPSNNIKVQNKDPKVLTIDNAKVRKAPTYLEQQREVIG